MLFHDLQSLGPPIVQQYADEQIKFGRYNINHLYNLTKSLLHIEKYLRSVFNNRTILVQSGIKLFPSDWITGGKKFCCKGLYA